VTLYGAFCQPEGVSEVSRLHHHRDYPTTVIAVASEMKY